MGKVVSRYCNICNRLITPREIERDEAIVYGTHAYCSKCKQEVMPIIEALRKRMGKEERKSRTGAHQRPTRPRRQQRDVVKTQVFFRRPPRRPAPEVVPVDEPVTEAQVVSEAPTEADGTELEPVDLGSLGKVGEEVPLPPGPVKVGGKLIKVAPEGVEYAAPAKRRPSQSAPRVLPADGGKRRTSPRGGTRRITRRHVPSAHKPARPREPEEPVKPVGEGASRIGLVLLLVVALAGGAGAGLYYALRKSPPKPPDGNGRTDDGGDRTTPSRPAEWKEKLESLRRRAETLSTLEEHERLRAELASLAKKAGADAEEEVASVRLRLDRWLDARARRQYETVMDLYKSMLQADADDVSRLRETLNRFDVRFAGTEWGRRMEAEKKRLEKSEEVLGRLREVLGKAEADLSSGKPAEAAKRLREFSFRQKEVVPEILRESEVRRQAMLKRAEDAVKQGLQRRLKAEVEWPNLRRQVDDLTAKHRFGEAEERLKRFRRAYEGSGFEGKVDAALARVAAARRAHELRTALVNGETRKGFWKHNDSLKVERGGGALELSAAEGEGRLWLAVEGLSSYSAELRLVRLAGVPRIEAPADSMTPTTAAEIPLVETAFPAGVEVLLTLRVSGRRVIYTVKMRGAEPTRSVARARGEGGGFVIVLPAGARLRLVSVRLTEQK